MTLPKKEKEQRGLEVDVWFQVLSFCDSENTDTISKIITLKAFKTATMLCDIPTVLLGLYEHTLLSQN